ncbi:MAG: PEGA domain-containing protein [Planctomycetota bacterium]
MAGFVRSSPMRLTATILVVFALCGCVERKLLLRSDPPGAEVSLDGTVVGQTPLDLPFVYYGGRRVTMRLEKHKAKSELIEVSAPWYQFTGLDFLFESLVPWTLTDEHEVAFVLQSSRSSGPEGGEPGGRLVRRAEQVLRREGLR